MNTTHKIVGAFAAVVAVFALGTTLQAAVADAARVSPAVTARAVANEQADRTMVQRNVAREPAREVVVSG
jgi:hypothetical protein